MLYAARSTVIAAALAIAAIAAPIASARPNLEPSPVGQSQISATTDSTTEPRAAGRTRSGTSARRRYAAVSASQLPEVHRQQAATAQALAYKPSHSGSYSSAALNGYTGSPTSTVPATVHLPKHGNPFQWGDAAIGAAGGLGISLPDPRRRIAWSHDVTNPRATARRRSPADPDPAHATLIQIRPRAASAAREAEEHLHVHPTDQCHRPPRPKPAASNMVRRRSADCARSGLRHPQLREDDPARRHAAPSRPVHLRLPAGHVRTRDLIQAAIKAHRDEPSTQHQHPTIPRRPRHGIRSRAEPTGPCRAYRPAVPRQSRPRLHRRSATLNRTRENLRHPSRAMRLGSAVSRALPTPARQPKPGPEPAPSASRYHCTSQEARCADVN